MKRTPDATPFAHLLSQRLTRRRVLAAGATLAPLAVAGGGLLSACTTTRSASQLSFKPIQGSQADAVLLPPGYRYDLLVRWGDSLWSVGCQISTPRDLPTACLLEPGAAERQQRQFGTNCDAIHFFPLDARGERGILCVNNEYTHDELMFPQHPGMVGALRGASRDYVSKNPQVVAVAKAAQGVSVIEIARVGGRWQLVKDSRFNRRITAETPMDIGGPARGAALMRTQADPDGVRALGTFGNCAGGETPWGTYLTAEENIQDYFAQSRSAQGAQRRRSAHRGIASPLAHVEGELAVRVGSGRRALRSAAHADRAVPLRLDRRDRSARSDARAGQAHGARPLRARGREPVHRAQRPRRRVHGRRRQVRVHLQVRFRRPLRSEESGRESRSARSRHACTSRGSMRAAAASGCRSCSTRRAR